MGVGGLREVVERTLDRCAGYKPDFMDVRVYRRLGTAVMVQDGRADRAFTHEVHGAAIRALVGGAWGFVALNKVTEGGLLKAAEEAVKMARVALRHLRERGAVAEVKPVEARVKAKVKVDPRDVPEDEKIRDVAELEAAARKNDPRIVNTVVSYSDMVSKETVGNTLGIYVEEESVRTLVHILVVAKEGDNRQRASEVRGGLEGYELVKGTAPEMFSVKAAERAVSLLGAEPAPAGRFTAVLNPAVVGLLSHEAFGHNCEADLVVSGESILAGMMGRRVASDAVTIVDDATVEGAYGSYVYDSEGVAGRRRVLVENGVLKSYLHSLETAAKLEAEPNGSARAYTHQVRPSVRMSNTYIKPGDRSFEELLEGVKEGVYLKGGYWGYVYVERGQFACNVEEGYVIRRGELGEHIRNVSFGGLTLETLKTVDAVGKDFELKLPGMCGKVGPIYVNGGGPHIRVREVVIGGQR